MRVSGGSLQCDQSTLTVNKTGEPMEAIPSSEPLDLHAIHSRIRELADLHKTSCDDVVELAPSDSVELLKDCALDLESRVKQIVSECSNVDSLALEDLDAYLERLKEELNLVEAEGSKISDEIEVLARTNVEDSTRLEADLERLEYALDLFTSEGFKKEKAGAYVICPAHGKDQSNLMKESVDNKLQLCELEDQIERNKTYLKSLQDLEYMHKWVDAIEQIEDGLTGLKVIAFTENCIRLSLQTYITELEDLLHQQKIEQIVEPFEVIHELLIEVLEGTMELKSVEFSLGMSELVPVPNMVGASDLAAELGCEEVALEIWAGMGSVVETCNWVAIWRQLQLLNFCYGKGCHMGQSCGKALDRVGMYFSCMGKILTVGNL
ncbi:hypothetical protein CJ030_MR5G020295 [Morella rubra]|uniref:Uncharacterized protein n=1 Tax=Morella rubra TaxID=262757 RepID=A0A6A1VNX4_9ROSI|nr:hypothetical protein CJ030_MR5G020295 [Morella rubra]